MKMLELLRIFFIQLHPLLFVIVLLVKNSVCHSHRRQFELGPDIPAHLPAPPKAAPPPPPDAGSVANVGGGQGGIPPFGFGNTPIPPPQNVPVGPGLGPLGPGAGALPADFVPFGLNHIILIMVPQFKTKFRKLPNWLESSVKVALPITVFFDKLELGPNFPAGLLPPGALRPGLGAPAQPGAAPIGPPGLNQTVTPNYYGSYPYNGLYPYFNHEADNDDEDEDSDDDADFEDSDSYSNYYAEDRKESNRRKRDIPPNQSRKSERLLIEMESTLKRNRNKRSIPYNRTIHSAERVTLLPKLESILDSQGLGGKSCLLRTICEVHEAPLHHYGLLGELFTMFFSVSRSTFAESHLPEYLRAERIGKSGDCSEFYKNCDKTMFSWEETVIHSNSNSDVENIISEDY